jgi:anti-sigma regulatory factor (Ser/Thr protein kinase)
LVLRDGADALREAQLAIADFLRRRGAGPNTAARAELLLEELALNTLRHGFASGDAPEVLVSAWHDGARCGLELEDRGGAFDPTAARLPAKPASLREARIGGLGLPLLHRIAAAMAYERTSDGRNRLWLALPAEDAATG